MITGTKLWTALITPMDTDGRIHWKDLERLLQRQEAAGTGILILCSTGDGLTIKDDEKNEMIEYVPNYNHSIQRYVGAGGIRQDNWTEIMDSIILNHDRSFHKL